MMISQEEADLERNATVWAGKPILRTVYARMHERIIEWIDRSIPGRVVEIGAGSGNFRPFAGDAVLIDRLFAPWLDVCGNAYSLPIRENSISHLVLFDVFHHLSSPATFLNEATKVASPGGRIIFMEPYISATSAVAYGLFHPEPIGWRSPLEETPSRESYAAQINATRHLFGDVSWLRGWRVLHREAFSAFAYLLSGGFSRPAFYPVQWLPSLERADRWLTRWPRIFGARCLVVLERIR
jgi:SAM-dependent methyltransferase